MPSPDPYRLDWTSDEAQQAIEGMVDAMGVSNTLDALQLVCRAKADHLRSNWQDDPAGDEWDIMGSRIELLAEDIIG